MVVHLLGARVQVDAEAGRTAWSQIALLVNDIPWPGLASYLILSPRLLVVLEGDLSS